MRPALRRAVLPLVCLLLAGPAAAAYDVERPDGEKNFVTDAADLLSPATVEKINTISAAVLKAKATPILVVTIPSIREVGGGAMGIEAFASNLFNEWQIGHAKLTVRGRSGKTETVDWNTGILLLVSAGDRKARIELGAGWAHDMDPQCTKIMNDYIIPQFKKGDYDAGVLAGVEMLDKMARGLEIPTPPRPTWHYVAIAGFFGLGTFTVVSLIRRGSGGWAWLFWGVVFALIGTLLYQMMTNRGGSGGGGFSGGSFGGGFSGGGGATGSW